MRRTCLLLLLPLIAGAGTLAAAATPEVDAATQALLDAAVRIAVYRDLKAEAAAAPVVQAVAEENADRWYRVTVTIGGTADIKPCYDVRIGRDPFGGTGVLEARLNLGETGRQLVAAQRADPDARVRARVATQLKSGVHPAQVQYQAGQYEDGDANGIGDYAATLDVLDGTIAVPTAQLKLSLLGPGFAKQLTEGGCRHVMLADHERQFWCFVVLPSGAETLAIDASGVVRVVTGAVQPKTVQEAKTVIAGGKMYRR